VHVEEYAYFVYSFAKRWFGNMDNMMSNCDVTNSSHQIQMTTMHMPLNETCPMKLFWVCHWLWKYFRWFL